MRPLVRAAGLSHLGGKDRQEDRWATAELPGGAVAAVADGMSDPTGRGRAGASGALADAACGAFVTAASELLAGGAGADPQAAVAAAAREAAATAAALGRALPGGAAFVGAWLGDDGTAVTVKVGDCRAWGLVGGRWQTLSARDDADRTGALTRWLGQPAERLGELRVTVRRGCRAVVLASDGVFRLTGPAQVLGDRWASALPFFAARDLVMSARRAGEADNITAAVLTTGAPRLRPGLVDVLTPSLAAIAATTAFVAGVLAASLLQGGPP